VGVGERFLDIKLGHVTAKLISFELLEPVSGYVKDLWDPKVRRPTGEAAARGRVLGKLGWSTVKLDGFKIREMRTDEQILEYLSARILEDAGLDLGWSFPPRLVDLIRVISPKPRIK
jgi:hypothetical protein